MNSIIQFFFKPTRGPASVALIRLPAGLIFFTQGVLKYIDPKMGVVRFARIGFAHPYFTAHFVGTFEIVCGFLVLLGLWTRAAAVPLLIVITTAIATTKIPELFRANQGLWFMVSDARTDFAMFCSLIFLICVAAERGPWTRGTARKLTKGTAFLEHAKDFTAVDACARILVELRTTIDANFVSPSNLVCNPVRNLPSVQLVPSQSQTAESGPASPAAPAWLSGAVGLG